MDIYEVAEMLGDEVMIVSREEKEMIELQRKSIYRCASCGQIQ